MISFMSEMTMSVAPGRLLVPGMAVSPLSAFSDVTRPSMGALITVLP